LLRGDEKQAHDDVSVNTSQPLGGADRVALDKTLDYKRVDFGRRGQSIASQFVD